MPHPVKSWLFRSEHSDEVHETLKHSDGSLSCSCRGWTRRVHDRSCRFYGIKAKSTTDCGCQRSCKHVRWVKLDVADQRAETSAVLVAEPVSTGGGKRQFNFNRRL